MARLRSLLAADVVVHSYRGGKRPTAMAPIVGVDGKIAAIYVVRNPDKLRHLEGGSVH